MTTAVLEKCLKVLKKSESDNERLAALLMITKVTKADDCDEACMKRIIDAIGFQFLSRLLRTGPKATDSSEGSNGQTFRSVAVNIISSFCSVPGVIDDPELAVLLPHIAALVVAKSNENEDVQQLVVDCYDFFMRIASLPHGPSLLIHSRCVPPLCQAVIEKCHEYEKGLQLLLHLCVVCGSKTWTNSEKHLLVLIQQLTHDIDTDKTSNKFELCTSLATILMSVPEDLLNKPDYATWQQVIQKLLFNLLQNKLAPTQRAPVLKLCSVLMEQCGVNWCLQWDQAESKFLLLLVHLACIEVRMALDTEDLKKINQAGNLLASCYSILEQVIQYMTAGPSLQLGDKQVSQLHSALVGAFNAIIHFLNRIADSPLCQDVMPTVIASVRVLGVWISEETTALKEEVIVLIPFLIQISRDTFYKSKQQLHLESPTTELEDRSSKNLFSSSTDEQMMELCDVDQPDIQPVSSSVTSSDTITASTDLEPFSSVEVLQFLMPGFCHLSAEGSARKVMLNCDLTQLLYEYLTYQFARLHQPKKSGADKEPQMALVTTCSVLLNIVVLEADLVIEKQIFGDILVMSVQKMSEMKGQSSDNLVLLYNLMLVSLLIIRHRHDKKDLSEEMMKDFFNQTVLLLKVVHKSAKQSKNDSVVLCNDIQWEEISEYWKLGMQVLSLCVTLFPWLVNIILFCQWVPYICSVLLNVKAESVPADVKGAYLELLLTLAKQDPIAKNVIKDSKGVQVSKKYEWSDLETILQ